MNIRSASESMTPQPMPSVQKPSIAAKRELHQFFVEEFQPAQFETIAQAWASNPEVRSDVLAKAKELATDPNYPSHSQLAQLAKMIVGDMQPKPPTTAPPMTEPPVTEPPAMPPFSEPPVAGPPVSAEEMM